MRYGADGAVYGLGMAALPYSGHISSMHMHLREQHWCQIWKQMEEYPCNCFLHVQTDHELREGLD